MKIKILSPDFKSYKDFLFSRYSLKLILQVLSIIFCFTFLRYLLDGQISDVLTLLSSLLVSSLTIFFILAFVGWKRGSQFVNIYDNLSTISFENEEEKEITQIQFFKHIIIVSYKKNKHMNKNIKFYYPEKSKYRKRINLFLKRK